MTDDKPSFQSTVNLRGDDNLQLVIRAHLYVESLLYVLLTQGLHRSEALNLDRITFMVKARLAVAMGLMSDEMLSPLTGLNNLRNKFSHHQDYQFTDKDKADLLNTIPKGVQHIILTDARDSPIHTKQDVPLERILLVLVCVTEARRQDHAEAKKQEQDAIDRVRAVLDKSNAAARARIEEGK